MVQHGHLPGIKSLSGLFNDEREKFMFICLLAGYLYIHEKHINKSLQSSLKYTGLLQWIFLIQFLQQ